MSAAPLERNNGSSVVVPFANELLRAGNRGEQIVSRQADQNAALSTLERDQRVVSFGFKIERPCDGRNKPVKHLSTCQSSGLESLICAANLIPANVNFWDFQKVGKIGLTKNHLTFAVAA